MSWQAGLYTWPRPSLAGVEEAESAGSLQSTLMSPGEPRLFPQPPIWPQPSGITIERAEAQVPRPLQPELTPLFLFLFLGGGGGPEPGKAHPTLKQNAPSLAQILGDKCTRLPCGPR